MDYTERSWWTLSTEEVMPMSSYHYSPPNEKQLRWQYAYSDFKSSEATLAAALAVFRYAKRDDCPDYPYHDGEPYHANS